MPRYALLIEYDGAPFNGWQRQRDLPSVQARVEAALARIEPDLPAIAAAGRTDTGVHATGQVAHCDLTREWDPFRLAEALNHHLKPDPVAVRAAAEVAPDWHARFSAIERRYLFRILQRRAPPVLDRGQVWHVRRPLDTDAMQEAAQHLVGHHDFTTFRSSECQARSPVKTIDEITLSSERLDTGREIRVVLRARSFLHNQVRSIVGSLERVGAGNWSPLDLKSALEARDRAACGPVAPPQGLVLTGVSYDPEVF